MCNLHWCYTFCTDVTLFALVLHLNCTALSQSESSNFFMYIISWVIKTPCLFYFRSVKFSYVKKTLLMLVASSLLALMKILAATQYWQKTTKETYVKICWQLNTLIRTWKCTCCTMQMTYLYSSDFCKPAKQAGTIRNYQSKVLCTIKHFLGNLQINSMPE